MSEFFDQLIAEALLKEKFSKILRKPDVFSKESDRIYNRIVDLAVIKVFENTIESDLLCVVFKSLSRTERQVILLNVLMDYALEDTASMIGSNRDSVYTLKSRALKKFQAAIEELDK